MSLFLSTWRTTSTTETLYTQIIFTQVCQLLDNGFLDFLKLVFNFLNYLSAIFFLFLL